MQQNKKNDTKAYVISFIAMGAVVVLYSLIFPMYRWQHYLIVAGIALLVGRVVFIMAQGLDTSRWTAWWKRDRKCWPRFAMKTT